MNKRIQELYSQATGMVSLQPSPTLEKFAELIQKDMIQNCRDMFIKGSVSWNLLNEKLELFGIEE